MPSKKKNKLKIYIKCATSFPWQFCISQEWIFLLCTFVIPHKLVHISNQAHVALPLSFFKMREISVQVRFRVLCFYMFSTLHFSCGTHESLHAHLALHSGFPWSTRCVNKGANDPMMKTTPTSDQITTFVNWLIKLFYCTI